ncbi:MAG: DUF2892 domain-containing protein [Flavobacteriales bacterium]
MKPNMGTADRWIRLIIAAVVVALYFTGSISGTTGIVLMVIAAVLALTGVVGTCPLYLPFGLRTSKP